MYGLVWINSKTQSELMTAGSDGTVKFWDIRMFDKLVTRKVSPFQLSDPIKTIKLFRCRETFIVDLDNKDRDSPGSLEAAQPVSVYGDNIYWPLNDLNTQVSFLEYDTTIPSKFMLGTDSGALLCCSRKARAQPDVVTAKFRCFIKLSF